MNKRLTTDALPQGEQAVSARRAPFDIASLKPLLLLMGIAAAVAAGVGVVLWSREPAYGLLYAELPQNELTQVVQSLQTAGIKHRLAGTGGVSVPAAQLHEARLHLAGQGLPAGESGFALLAKDPGFGISQFMEGARYQHALEGELARTIGHLQAVAGARVHLALPKQSAFVRDSRSAGASVLLQLRPGRRLEPGQVAAIVNLVASSVPELPAERVTVVDQQGRLLSATHQGEQAAERERQLEIAREIEDRYTRRVEELLVPIVGSGRVRAQVTADVDMASVEEAREQFRPQSQIVRSESTSEQLGRTAQAVGGIPGALSNQPPEPGVALPPGVSASVTAAEEPVIPQNSARQATRNYEIDRTLAYTRQPAGGLRRITVAVLVDNLRVSNGDGSISGVAHSDAQLKSLTTLVKDAVGFNEARGDSVSVVNASFTGDSLPQTGPNTIPWWQQPLMRDVAKLAAGALVLLALVSMVLRPLVRGLMSATTLPAALPATVAALPEPMPGADLDYDGQIDAARSLVAQDPARVAQVVKSWVGKDE